jgi:RNA polymerase sporulation-specific sigma factor
MVEKVTITNFDFEKYGKENRIKNKELLEKTLQGDKTSQEEFILTNIGLIYHIIYKHFKFYENKEDLLQTGVEYFIKALKKYDTKRNISFTTFIYVVIREKLYNYIIKDNKIKVPRYTYKRIEKIKEEREKFYNDNGIMPNIEELSRLTGYKKNNITALMDTTKTFYELDSIENKEKKNELKEKTELANLNKENKNIEKIEIHSDLITAIKKLTEFEKEIIYLKFNEEKKITEIANITGKHKITIGKTLKKTLEKLKKDLI